MVDVSRVKVVWNGPPVTGGGVSVFYTRGAGATFSGQLATFFNSLLGNIPTSITISTPNSGDVLDDASGAIVGAWSGGTAQNLATVGTGSYAAGVGARVVWNTAGIHHRRRVKGSTFIVPLTAGTYDNNGTLITSFVTAMNNAATALVAAQAGNMVILSRAEGDPPSGGQSSVVTSGQGVDMVSWLRTRRT